jgi:hypothetical protein
MDDEKEEQGGFKVTDRRQFTTEGDVREQPPPEPSEQAPPQKEEPPKASQEEKPQPEAAQEENQKEEAKQDPGQGVNFASFLLSLATTGMVHLGEIPEPSTGQKMEDLEAAHQMIDILAILKEKTEGNLSAEESHLLENVLYELRMKFMGKSKAIKL